MYCAHLCSIKFITAINDRPQLQSAEALLQHDADSEPAEPTLSYHEIVRISEHNFAVKFHYSDGSIKSFDGRNWS